MSLAQNSWPERLPGVHSICTQEGNYGPIQSEIFSQGLEVQGELPQELNGVYLRSKCVSLQCVIN